MYKCHSSSSSDSGILTSAESKGTGLLLLWSKIFTASTPASGSKHLIRMSKWYCKVGSKAGSCIWSFWALYICLLYSSTCNIAEISYCSAFTQQYWQHEIDSTFNNNRICNTVGASVFIQQHLQHSRDLAISTYPAASTIKQGLSNQHVVQQLQHSMASAVMTWTANLA